MGGWRRHHPHHHRRILARVRIISVASMSSQLLFAALACEDGGAMSDDEPSQGAMGHAATEGMHATGDEAISHTRLLATEGGTKKDRPRLQWWVRRRRSARSSQHLRQYKAKTECCNASFAKDSAFLCGRSMFTEQTPQSSSLGSTGMKPG